MKRYPGTLVLAVAATAVVAVAASPHHGADAVTSIRFDQRRAANLLERDGGIYVSELLRQVGSIELRARAPARLVPFHPKGWESMAGVYVVAAPISGERPTSQRGEAGWPVSPSASVGIGVLFGTPARSDR